MVVERGEDAVDIVAEAGGDADRLLVAAEGLGVEQSGIELGPVVERHPATVEVEARGADVAAHQLWKEELAVLDDVAALAGETGDIAVAMGLLHLDKRSEEHTSELQTLMRISYSVFRLKKTKKKIKIDYRTIRLTNSIT